MQQNSNCDQAKKKLKLEQNSKTPIVTKVRKNQIVTKLKLGLISILDERVL